MKASLLHLSAPEDSSFLCFRRCEPKVEFDWHFHPEYQLEFFIRSKARQFAGDRVVDVKAGELVLIGPYLPHSLATESAARPGQEQQESVLILFQENCLGTGFFDRPELRRVRELLERCRKGLLFSRAQCRHLADRIRRMPRQNAFDRLMALLSILQQLAAVNRAESLASEAFEPSIARIDYERINRVCRHIDENLSEPLTERDVAELIYLGPNAFSRFFKRVTGQTFIDYVCALRIGKACKLLIDTEKPILDICFDVGFGNKSNFNRQFKRRRGMSPQRFRDLYHDTAEASELYQSRCAGYF